MKIKALGATALVSVGCALAVVGTVRIAHSADHLDSPSTKADPTVDIDDLYGWMDGNNLVLALTVFPAALGPAPDGGGGSKFSNAVQYAIHVSSGPSFGTTTATKDVICTFDASQAISCWLGTDEFVTGNAGQASGIASADGKFKVFAGLRSDPFFFNLDGFKQTEADVEGAGALSADMAGCPTLPPATAAALVTQLKTAPDGGPPNDFFGPLNGLAIVVSIDKSLVTAGGPIVATWAGTYRSL
jgi:hypothetical protein